MSDRFEGLTMEEGRQWTRERADAGVPCPCCTQFVKVYTRPINSGMAHALIQMWKHAGTEWFYLPNITSRWQGRDEACLKYWGLIEELQEKRDDGGRKGWWRVTERGQEFVKRSLRVQKYARIYDNRVLSLTGEMITIVDALGEKFNYQELMDR
jgi:hypothetical protein